MLIAIHEMKRHAHCNTWSEAVYSMPYKKLSYMLIAIHIVKL